MAFYMQSKVKDLHAGDRVLFWFSPGEAHQLAKQGEILGFVMTSEGEIVRMHVDGRPENETSMLLVTSVLFVSRPS